MTKTLIFATSYCATEARRDLMILWAKLVTKLNPDADILMVDSASPFDPSVFLRDYYKIRVHRFDDNIGHLSGNGKDGWGRAFCWGLHSAAARGYNRVAYMDSDILFAKPVAPIFEKMARHRVGVCAPMDLNYQWIENGLVFFNFDIFDPDAFIKAYDWENAPQYPLPEIRFEQILADEIFTLPLRGCRNDWDAINVANLKAMFPLGVSYITHCRDPQVYQEFLRLNKLEV